MSDNYSIITFISYEHTEEEDSNDDDVDSDDQATEKWIPQEILLRGKGPILSWAGDINIITARFGRPYPMRLYAMSMLDL